MNFSTLLLLGVGGAAVYYLVKHSSAVVTVNPQTAAATGAAYVPPAYGVQTNAGWPSPAAPGPYAWGAIPQQPTDAQQAAQVIGAIGGLAAGIGNIISAATNSDNG